MTLETEFNSIYVIESLRRGENRTGRSLYEGVLREHAKKSAWLEVEYLEAMDRRAFDNHLTRVLERARHGRLPILHLEAHGSRAGIHLANGPVVRWEELREVLTSINEATQSRLLLMMAMCKGAYLATILRPPQRAPAWGVVGPEVDIDDLPMEAGMWMQYEALLGEKGGDAALKALNAAQDDPAQRYYFRSAEVLFHHALWHFFRNRTPEVVKEHENLLVAEATKKWGSGVDIAMKARKIASRRLSDESYWYEFWRPRFLMLDKFPENAERFKLTYQDFKAARDTSWPDGEAEVNPVP